MRLVIISDTHGRHAELSVPDGDCLLHCGDYTMSGRTKEVNSFSEWFQCLPHKSKIYIDGNHDFNGERRYYGKSNTPPIEGVTYLCDSETSVNGLRIYGSPWTPLFGSWAFMLPRGKAIKSKWDLIPEGIDVLITHGPPYNLFDRPYGGYEHVGCEDLLDRVLKVKPRIHCFGHIHGDHGMKEINGTWYINASTVGEDYKVRNEPVVIDV